MQGISGGADDGSRLYFVARGVLTGSQVNAHGEVAQAERPNLYLASDLGGNHALSYVATLSPWNSSGVSVDQGVWWDPIKGSGALETAWSPSGQYLVFTSYKPLTSVDKSPPPCSGPGGECKELFVYDADSEALNCISCPSDGSESLGSTSITPQVQGARAHSRGPRYPTRVVFDSGRILLQTPNSLSPKDVNGVSDVYEYQNGVSNLISSGTAVGGSGFLDASDEAHDVFFATAESLVGSDTDGGVPSVYDARVGGGFSEPPHPSEACGGEDTCRAPAGPPPPSASPGTSATGGSGNVRLKSKAVPCKKGKVRGGGRCVKRHKHHQRQKQHRNAKHGGKH